MLETSSDSLETHHENMRHPWYVDIGGNSSLNIEDLKNTFPSFLLNLWCEGISVDWKLWYAETNYQKIALPTYPFAKTRYWLDSYKEDKDASPSYLPYEGKEVVLEIVRDHIAIIKMQDVEHHNSFTKKLLHGLQAKFREASQNDQVKVIILTGYENIFSMGGDEQLLVAIANGEAKFSDIPFIYKGLLECRVPVISAIQGMLMAVDLHLVYMRILLFCRKKIPIVRAS